ncbi:MAG TPA: IniB N-terminal domain-containing protein [Pseudonocardiaceae bacterium]
MTMATTLMDFILGLLRDNDAKAAFNANPEKALHDAGLGGVCGQDVADAMSYVAEYHPVSFVGDREYNVGNSHISQSGEGHHSGAGHQPDSHDTAVHQLEYVTNNYSYVDSHDTVIDKSVNQEIWNKGILTQSFDDHSVTATDHSVAAGHDIEGSNVATGDHDITGNGNNVGNTTTTYDHSINGSFNGNNLADHGSVAGNGNDGNVTNPAQSTVATNGGEADNSTHDSHNTTTTDSHNTTTVDSNNQDSHNHDSHNVDVHKVDIHNVNSHNADSHDFSHNDDSAITHTDQHGLLNLDASPAVNVPIHDNDVDVLSHHAVDLPL